VKKQYPSKDLKKGQENHVGGWKAPVFQAKRKTNAREQG
jgi:hypothetical protein